jgi:hypothetical protein
MVSTLGWMRGRSHLIRLFSSNLNLYPYQRGADNAFHPCYHIEEVLMGKLALFLGGFLLLTLLVGLLGTIPPG